MKHSNTKEVILQTGTRILLQKGYNDAGLQEILKEAGVPKGSFYHFFKSKQAFGKEVLAEYALEFEKILQKHLGDIHVPPLVRLHNFFLAMIEHFEQTQACKGGCLVGNLAQELADTNEEFREQIQKVMRNWQDYFETCLEQAREKGDLGSDADPADIAEVMFNGWEGAVMKMKVVNSVDPLRSFVRVMFQMLANLRSEAESTRPA